MTTLQEAPTSHEVLTTVAPTLPSIGTIVFGTNSAVTPLHLPIPNANETIVNVAPQETTEHEKPLTDAEPIKTLDEYAKAINEAHQICEAADKESKQKGRDAIAAGIKAGKDLIQAKEMVGHGNWGPWLEANCKEVDERMAQRYMKLAKSDIPVSDLNLCASLRQAFIAVGALSPQRHDKAPEINTSETVKTTDANTPDIILPQMQRGFAMLQKQYDTLVKSNPGMETHLLSIDMTLTLRELFQRWQVPLSDVFNYFDLPSIEDKCVRCGHVREPDEYFIPIHHWAPEYKYRFEWCEQCADEYHEQLNDDFDISKEIKLLTESLNALKSMSVKDYTLAQKLYQLKETKIAKPDIIAAAETNVWMPTDLDNEQATIEQIERVSPKIVIARDKDSNVRWNIYRHFVSSAVNYATPGRYIKFLVVDDSQSDKLVLGVGAISSDFSALVKRDDFIGWTKEQREGGKLKNTAIGSTIVATQPFGFNFNGGKLIAALITSQEIRDEWQSRHGDVLAGMTTTSLFGTPSMYDRIAQWKRLGQTTGSFPIQPRLDIYNRWKAFLKASRSYELKQVLKEDENGRAQVTQCKQKIIAMIFKAAGLNISDFEHGHRRGVYFASFFENTNDFLCGKVTEADLRPKPLFQETVQQITDRWRKKAITRYLNLKQDGVLKPQKQSYSQLGQMDFETAKAVFLNDVE